MDIGTRRLTTKVNSSKMMMILVNQRNKRRKQIKKTILANKFAPGCLIPSVPPKLLSFVN